MKDLFGNEIDVFLDAKERYGIWPVTVWDVDKSDEDRKMLKELVNDDGSSRKNLNTYMASSKNSTLYGKNGIPYTSSFDPSITAWILNLYAPKEGICYDPFAGGGTRAIMAAKHGLVYIGCEIRQGEIDAVKQRCEACGVYSSVQISLVDARRPNMPDNLADFSYTCPPYYNLEQYDGGEDDLSMAPTYMHFCSGISSVMNESIRILKRNSLAVWVVGLLRKDDGELIPLHHDIARLGKAAGFRLKEEIILAHRNNGAIRRVGNFEKGDKFLIRTHEYALVFEKR